MIPFIDLASSVTPQTLLATSATTQIQTSFNTYTWLFSQGASLEWGAARDKAEAWHTAMANHVPELLEELDQLAVASAKAGVSINGRPVDLRDFVTLNARSEIMASMWATPLAECTTLLNKGQNQVVFGQTWDWFGAQRDALTMQSRRSEKTGTFVTITEAGMLAKIGANEAGLCLGLNFLSSGSGPAIPSAENNWVLPVHVLLRLLLERCDTVDSAKLLLTELRPSGAANITVADSFANAAMWECMPASAPVEVPPLFGPWSIHTNHCVVAEAEAKQGDMGDASWTTDRYDRASSLVKEAGSADPSACIEAILEDTANGYHAICQPPDPSRAATDRDETVFAVIMRTGTGGSPSIRVAAGRPDVVAFDAPLLVARR